MNFCHERNSCYEIACLVTVLYLMLPLRPRGKNRPLPFLAPAVTIESTCAPGTTRIMSMVQFVEQNSQRFLAGCVWKLAAASCRSLAQAHAAGMQGCLQDGLQRFRARSRQQCAM